MFWSLKVLNGLVSALCQDWRYEVVCLFMVCLKNFKPFPFNSTGLEMMPFLRLQSFYLCLIKFPYSLKIIDKKK